MDAQIATCQRSMQGIAPSKAGPTDWRAVMGFGLANATAVHNPLHTPALKLYLQRLLCDGQGCSINTLRDSRTMLQGAQAPVCPVPTVGPALQRPRFTQIHTNIVSRVSGRRVGRRRYASQLQRARVLPVSDRLWVLLLVAIVGYPCRHDTSRQFMCGYSMR